MTICNLKIICMNNRQRSEAVKLLHGFSISCKTEEWHRKGSVDSIYVISATMCEGPSKRDNIVSLKRAKKILTKYFKRKDAEECLQKLPARSHSISVDGVAGKSVPFVVHKLTKAEAFELAELCRINGYGFIIVERCIGDVLHGVLWSFGSPGFIDKPEAFQLNFSFSEAKKWLRVNPEKEEKAKKIVNDALGITDKPISKRVEHLSQIVRRSFMVSAEKAHEAMEPINKVTRPEPYGNDIIGSEEIPPEPTPAQLYSTFFDDLRLECADVDVAIICGKRCVPVSRKDALMCLYGGRMNVLVSNKGIVWRKATLVGIDLNDKHHPFRTENVGMRTSWKYAFILLEEWDG